MWRLVAMIPRGLGVLEIRKNEAALASCSHMVSDASAGWIDHEPGTDMRDGLLGKHETGISLYSSNERNLVWHLGKRAYRYDVIYYRFTDNR